MTRKYVEIAIFVRFEQQTPALVCDRSYETTNQCGHRRLQPHTYAVSRDRV